MKSHHIRMVLKAANSAIRFHWRTASFVSFRWGLHHPFSCFWFPVCYTFYTSKNNKEISFFINI